MYQIKKGLKIAFFAAVTAISFLATGNVSAEDGVVATFTPPLLANRHRDSSWNKDGEIADRHSDSRSSWNQRQEVGRAPSREAPAPDRSYYNPRPDQGYYYWNDKYFVGRPNFYNRPYYYYYYDPKYFYDDSNGSVRYYPNPNR